MAKRKTNIVATISPDTIRRILKLDPKRDINYKLVKQALTELALTGVDVFRLNMSFRNDQFIKHIFQWFKDHHNNDARMVCVLADLQGPKLRLGDLEETDHGPAGKGVLLEKGQEYRLYFQKDDEAHINDSTSGNDKKAVVLLNDELFDGFGDCIIRGFGEVHGDAGIEIAVGDGNVILLVQDSSSIKSTYVSCIVEVGGIIQSGKGIMPKAISVDVPEILTDKDIKDLRFLLYTGKRFLSFIALSFVKGPLDLLRVREEIMKYQTYKRYLNNRIKEIKKEGDRPDRAEILHSTLLPGIIAKIETVEAVKSETLSSIIDVADGVMIARGDLALQMDYEDVPREQKEIIRLCRLRGKPVITATQMLHSMEHHPRPTRSEVNDVFNAVMDGTDATMLSGETSSGDYPREAVKTMSRILKTAEDCYQASRPDETAGWAEMSKALKEIVDKARQRLESMQTTLAASGVSNQLRQIINTVYKEKISKTIRQSTTDVICMSAWTIISSSELVAIIAATTSGRTARMLARYRPDIPIYGATHDEENRRKLLLSYGIHPINIGLGATTTEDMYKSIIEKLKSEGYLRRIAHPPQEYRDLALMVSGEPLGDPGSTNQTRLTSLRDKGFEVCD